MINYPKNNNIWFKILVKFVLKKYNNNLKDWSMNYIKQVKKTYSKVLRAIYLEKKVIKQHIRLKYIIKFACTRHKYIFKSRCINGIGNHIF